MTAITLLIRELCDLSDAFWHNEFNFVQSIKYYRTKRRLQLFWFHCRAHWLRQPSKDLSGYTKTYSMRSAADASIDFAATEASAAYRPIDVFDEKQIDFLDDIEIVNGMEFNASFYEYSDALLKYHSDDVGQLCEGLSFTFSGKIAINCERFSINFVYGNETRDIALHINPRLPQNYIVRNSKVNDVWGHEEVSSALPFLLRRGDAFAIQVFITDACYMISINGHHFAEFAHRLPYSGVRRLEVKGDVEDLKMERTMVQYYPQRLTESAARSIEAHLDEELDEVDSNEKDMISIPHEWCLINSPAQLSDNSSKSNCATSTNQGLTLPYYGKLLPKSLKEGRCLRIEGRVRLLPHSFYINLQQGQNIWPHPIIAFHLNPRFSQSSSGAIGKAVVCRNAWYNGSWAQEELSELDTNFRPGRTFSLAIVCGKSSFEVYVNRQFITEFKYHVKPDIVDTVYIQGDVKLWNVTLEPNPMIKGKNVRVYHNPLYIEDF